MQIVYLKKKIFWLAIILGLGLLALLVHLFCHIDLPYPPTKYAAGYSRSEFDAIQVGDSAQRVYSLLGMPLFTDENVYQTYAYTFVGVPAKFYSEYSTIVRVDDTTGYWSNKFPPGTSIFDVEEAYGKPTDETIVAHRILLGYSSPKVGDRGSYWIRWIYLDAAGEKVVGKLSKYYSADGIVKEISERLRYYWK